MTDGQMPGQSKWQRLGCRKVGAEMEVEMEGELLEADLRLSREEQKRKDTRIVLVQSQPP